MFKPITYCDNCHHVVHDPHMHLFCSSCGQRMCHLCMGVKRSDICRNCEAHESDK